jgi:hypothetical protein
VLWLHGLWNKGAIARGRKWLNCACISKELSGKEDILLLATRFDGLVLDIPVELTAVGARFQRTRVCGLTTSTFLHFLSFLAFKSENMQQ